MDSRKNSKNLEVIYRDLIQLSEIKISHLVAATNKEKVRSHQLQLFKNHLKITTLEVRSKLLGKLVRKTEKQRKIVVKMFQFMIYLQAVFGAKTTQYLSDLLQKLNLLFLGTI
jgi:hypothetical protein